MKKQFTLSLTFLALGLIVSGCSNAKESLGLKRTAPDEFAVISRAPLELPPEYSLRPPRPGAPRPQEATPYEQSKSVVFGQTTQSTQQTSPDNGESVLLQKAGANSADPAIRVIVDAEHEATKNEDKPVAEKLLGIKLGGRDKEETIDPVKEKQRLSGTPEDNTQPNE